MFTRKVSIAIYIAVFLFAVITKSYAEELSWHGYVKLDAIDNFHGAIKNGWALAGGTRIYGQYDLNKFLGAMPVSTVVFGLLAVDHTHRESEFTPTEQNISSLTSRGILDVGDLAIWSRYTDNFLTRIGIMDLEDYFTIEESASFLINSGFGNPMAMDDNTVMVTFPYPGFGAMGEYNDKNAKIMAGIFQGNPKQIHTVFYQGYMLLAEVDQIFTAHSHHINNYSYKLGVWKYQQSNPSLGENSVGMYLIAQMHLNFFQDFAPFFEFSYCSQDEPNIPAGANIGVQITGLFPQRLKDIFTAGLARVWIHNLPSETVYESSYAIYLMQSCYLIADLQYIHHPSGIYKNGWAGMARLRYTF